MNGPHGTDPDFSADDEAIARIATMRAAKRDARSLYWRGWKVAEIAREHDLAYTTVDSWRKREGWDKASPINIVEDRLEVRIANLIDKDPFTEGDMKRVDFLMRQMERAARIQKYTGGGNEADLNPKVANRNSPEAKAKAIKGKNLLTHEDVEKCRTLFEGELFGHQRKWWEASGEVIRFILKSRQIGATWYFAREAFMRAMDTGNNQIFLSASQAQADVFRKYIFEFVLLATGKELKGSKQITVRRVDADGERLPDVTFYFLATNRNTAQSYSGDLYLDEVFWVPGFTEFEAVASAMASHKHFRRTYFSTPSTITHQAYGKWSGTDWNRGRTKAAQRVFEIGHRALKSGMLGPDGIWRQIVTLDDAIEQGFNLIDRAAKEAEYSVDQFRNKYMCEFLDDTMSAFPWAMVGPCMIDSFYKWRDFSPAACAVTGSRPFGAKEVWISVDPNNQGLDDAAIAVIAPPEKPGGKFRFLEKMRFTGEDFAGQERRIREVASRYTVTDLSVDISGGMGKAVHELIKKWFPNVRGISYTVSSKQALVLKGQNVMRNGRFEMPAEWSDVQSALMAIHPAITPSGGQVTYKTSRVEGQGHGDIAWALLGALSNEPLDAATVSASGGGFVMFSD